MIFQIFTEDQNLLKYLSDNPKLDAIPREYLLSILANIKRVEYENKYIKLKFWMSLLNGLKQFMPINP